MSNDTIGNELVARWNGLTGVDVYGSGESTSAVIAEIAKAARDVPKDAETAKGRALIASTANKVARLKVHLDGLGKDLVSEWKTKSSAVDAERKRLRDELDSLKAEVRAPLTEWEDAKAAKEVVVTAKIDAFRRAATGQDKDGLDLNAAKLTAMLARVRLAAIDESVYGEHTNEAAAAKDGAIRALENLAAKRAKDEAEAAELARLRAEAAERERTEREDRIRREAAETAKAEAEARARAEAEVVAAKARAEIDAKERERREAVDREERARLDAELSAKRERERIEARERARDEAEAKRKADTQNIARITDEIVSALLECDGVDRDTAKTVAGAIISGDIPHVGVRF